MAKKSAKRQKLLKSAVRKKVVENNEKKEEVKKGNELKIIVTIAFIGVAFLASYWIVDNYIFEKSNVPEGEAYFLLNNDTLICDYQYICYLVDGDWHKYAYSAGTNLILANQIEIADEGKITEFFRDKKHLNIVLNSTSTNSVEFSETLISTTNIFMIYGYYFNSLKEEGRTTTSYVYSDYNLTEPALLILGPNMGAKEDSIIFDGKNVIVQGTNSESLNLLLGKLLLIMIS